LKTAKKGLLLLYAYHGASVFKAVYKLKIKAWFRKRETKTMTI